jgi:hypothetical protein
MPKDFHHIINTTVNGPLYAQLLDFSPKAMPFVMESPKEE